jgi:hypothetical protein
LTHKSNDYIWLQLTREFFNLEKDIYLCFIYDPPGNSTYTFSRGKYFRYSQVCKKYPYFGFHLKI